MIISADKVTKDAKGIFFAEASDIGFSVGKFPLVVRVGAEGKFEYKNTVSVDEDVLKWVYKNVQTGEHLFIIND